MPPPCTLVAPAACRSWIRWTRSPLPTPLRCAAACWRCSSPAVVYVALKRCWVALDDLIDRLASAFGVDMDGEHRRRPDPVAQIRELTVYAPCPDAVAPSSRPSAPSTIRPISAENLRVVGVQPDHVPRASAGRCQDDQPAGRMAPASASRNRAWRCTSPGIASAGVTKIRFSMRMP